MIEPGPVTRALLETIGEVADDSQLAQRICTLCVTGLDVDGAAISLLIEGAEMATLWATDTTAELLEDLQFALNEGPSIQAAAIGSPVLVSDLDEPGEASSWPMFADAVAERTSVRALFALPLQWGAIKLGVLDLHRVEPGGLSEVQRRDVLAAADTASVLMLGLRTGPGDDRWLDPAMSHRAEIHQATGMVLAQLGVSATEALTRMRAHAFAEQRLLSEVARDVVSRQLRFSPEMS